MKKFNRSIFTNTLKSLLARSGNQCAFPNCSHPLFNDDDLFIAQLCHIEAVAPTAPRYNENQTDEKVNSYSNLLFLCYRHHKETDDEVLYTVERLQRIKEVHESKFKENTYNYSHIALEKLIDENTHYWEKIKVIHSKHVAPEQAVPIDGDSTILELINQIYENIYSLDELNSALMSDLKKDYFGFTCLAIPNTIARSSTALNQIEIKYIEELLLKEPENKVLRRKLKKARKEFQTIAKRGGLAD